MQREYQLLGTHRGTVVDNNDPMKLGRLKVLVPAAYSAQAINSIPWAFPKLSIGDFRLPEVGQCVYVEFLANDGKPDPAHPIWTGTWFGQNESPDVVKNDSSENSHHYKVFETSSGNKIVFSDKPDEKYIRIEHSSGSYILFENNGDIIIKGNVIRLN